MASAITTTATLDNYLGTHPYSPAQTALAVAWANEAIENYCERIFASTVYHEWKELSDTDTVILDHRPIVTLNQVSAGTTNVMSLAYTDAAAGAIGVVTIDQTNLTLQYGAPPVTAAYTPLPATITLLAAMVVAAGWTATLTEEALPLAIKPVLTQDALNTTIYLEGPGTPVAVDIDPDAALLTLPSARSGWVYVMYKAGYGTIPSELEQIATEMAATFLARKGDPTVTSERVGNTAFTYGGGGDIMSAFYPRLDKFRARSL